MSEDRAEYGLCRYAVLQHSGVAEPHYDLLFETSLASSLVTFRLTEWPLTRDQFVTRLKDHRRLYLTYEGQIPGGDRGRVDRLAEGQLQVTHGPTGWKLSHSPDHPWLLLSPDDLNPSSDQWWAKLLNP